VFNAHAHRPLQRLTFLSSSLSREVRNPAKSFSFRSFAPSGPFSFKRPQSSPLLRGPCRAWLFAPAGIDGYVSFSSLLQAVQRQALARPETLPLVTRFAGWKKSIFLSDPFLSRVAVREYFFSFPPTLISAITILCVVVFPRPHLSSPTGFAHVFPRVARLPDFFSRNC